MAFCFKRKEPVPKAIRRLGCQRARHAIECLNDCSTPEGIHDARREIKRARAVLRLARASISKKEFRFLKKRLKRAAACLAKLRDAAVRARTLRDLTRRFKSELPAGAFRKYRIELRRAFDRAMRRFEQKQKAQSAERHLRAVARDFRNLPFDENGWVALAPGVESAYRQCRAAYQHATNSAAATDFHEWRKRAKDLYHQLRLLEPIWPEKMDRMACELETVGDFLGEDHDLFILEEAIDRLGRESQKPKAVEVDLLRRIIHERQGELRANAISMGKYFYVETPAQFATRLGGYWRLWQRNKNSGGKSRTKGSRA